MVCRRSTQLANDVVHQFRQNAASAQASRLSEPGGQVHSWHSSSDSLSETPNSIASAPELGQAEPEQDHNTCESTQLHVASTMSMHYVVCEVMRAASLTRLSQLVSAAKGSSRHARVVWLQPQGTQSQPPGMKYIGEHWAMHVQLNRTQALCTANTGDHVVVNMPDEKAAQTEPPYPRQHVTMPTGVAETAFAEDPEAEEAAVALQDDPFLAGLPAKENGTIVEGTALVTGSCCSPCMICSCLSTLASVPCYHKQS